MESEADIYLLKAEESLRSAESDLEGHRYNSAANRAYYACFQAAPTAPIREGIRPSGARWDNDWVQAQFAGRLVSQRKRYSPELRDALERLFVLRQVADYKTQLVAQIQAARAVRRTREFVNAVSDRSG